MSPTKATAKKPKPNHTAVLTRVIKSLVTALEPEALVLLTVLKDGAEGYDIRVRFQPVAVVSEEVKKLSKQGNDVMILAGSKPRRRASKSTPTA
jgi:hypothetical protein